MYIVYCIIGENALSLKQHKLKKGNKPNALSTLKCLGVRED